MLEKGHSEKKIIDCELIIIGEGNQCKYSKNGFTPQIIYFRYSI